MLIKFIITEEDRFEIETFDVDVKKNRICRLNAANRGSYLQSLNEFILKDISSRRIIPE
jgi:hypothetical protein